MHAPLVRALAVGGATVAVAGGLATWLAPVALAPGTGLDGELVRGCAAVGAVAALWLALVATVVTAEALAPGTPRLPGVPVVLRRLLLTACGAAVAAGLTAPAGAATGRQDPPQTAASVVASAIAGLPLPDRPHGGVTSAPRPDPAPLVTVRPGDTLWDLAAEHLGDGARWTELYAANRSAIGADPDLIRPAERLRIPAHPKEIR
ncbi:LysM peptidoglycan-binding domain-containing protein [Nocardioides sp.]|uniref:LysM peptidoglycan-binding domain-containing protein n=1 Tax=Nocardioides sp. TaxID=35761 RepID=UPI00378473F1